MAVFDLLESSEMPLHYDYDLDMMLLHFSISSFRD